MVNDDVVKCPLCGGFTHVAEKHVLEALRDPKLRERVESFVAELRKAQPELAGVGASNGEPRDFQKDVHGWNPNVPMWRRSSKE